MLGGMRRIAILRGMSSCSYIVGRAGALGTALALALPAAASAHLLSGTSDPNRPLLEYLGLGILHMVGGWDHLLFIAGIVLLSGGWRTSAKLISLFVAGHSLTLLVATLAGWQLNATVVDVVIALSLVYVGVQGFLGRPGNVRLVGAIVFAFGLVHGLGLSTRLQALGLPETGLVERIVLFNIGVEIGQLAALGVIVGVATLVTRHVRKVPDVRRPAFGALAVAGLAAAVVLPLTAHESGAAPVETAAVGADGQPSACTEGEAQPPVPAPGSGHPAKAYYGPEETPPVDDLAHVVGDGYVIVRYSPDLTAAEHQELEQWVTSRESNGTVIAAPDAEQSEPVRAVTAYEELSCASVDLNGLSGFRDRWLGTLQG